MRIPFTNYDLEVKQRGGQEVHPSPPAQTRETYDQFGAYFNNYVPLKFNLDLYDVIREAIPILDIAVIKYVRLIGDFKIVAENESTQAVLDDFIKNVKVGHFFRGFGSWVDQMTDSVISKGMAFGEVIPEKSLTGINRLKIAKANDFRFIKEGNDLVLGQLAEGNIFPVKLENQDYVHYLAFDIRDGHPQGYSMFYSLPFVTQIFIRLAKTIENQLWRVGDPTFVSIIEGGKDSQFTELKDAATSLQSGITEAMKARKAGKVQDISGAAPKESKIRIETLGKDAEIMPLEVPVHVILEQVVSRTGFPPFVFGLYKWTSTERMSTEQNDMIVANIESYRHNWQPIIEKVIDTFLILRGNAGAKWTLEWNPVNLLDETEQARARSLNAAAMEKEINAYINLLLSGLIDENEFTETMQRLGYVSPKFVKENGKKYVLNSLIDRTKHLRSAQIAKSLLGVPAVVPTNGKHKREGVLIEN